MSGCIPCKTSWVLVALCALLMVGVQPSAGEEDFLPPEGVFKGEAGTLSLHYLGDMAVKVKLQSSNCFYEDPGIMSFTDGPHLLHSYHNQEGLLLVIFFERDYAVVSAEMPGFAERFCHHGISDATGYYPRIE